MNLRDRVRSEQNSKPKEIELKNEDSQNILIDTTPKSMQPSMEELLQKQSEALRIVTEQRDRLLSEGRLEDQERISDLSSQISMLQSKISEMQSKHQSEVSKLMKQNRSLQKNNDELRNKGGIWSRKEQEECLKEVDELRSELKMKDKQIDMCRVNKYQDNVHRRLKAESDARKAESEAKKAISEAKKEYDKRKKEVDGYAENIRTRNGVFCALIAIVLVIGAVMHTAILADIQEVFKDIPAALGMAIFNALPRMDGWFKLLYVIIGLVVCGGYYIALAYLLVRLRLVWNLLTVSFCTIDLAICVFIGDILPFNRLFLLIGMAVAYLIFVAWADKHWGTEYEKEMRWRRFKTDLLFPVLKDETKRKVQ